jgi:ABC-type transport system involved in multi-copper enzyme maturation permease subunit
MLKTLVAREIRGNLLNQRFVLAYSICTLLVVVSAAIMYSDYVGRQRDYNVIAASGQRSGMLQEWELAFDVFRPPLLASMFASGGERDADDRAIISSGVRPLFRGNIRRNPLVSFFPTADLLFVIGTVITLLTFVLVFDSISGEFETGTMKILLAGPVPRDQIFLAKWLGGAVSIGFPFITSLALVAAILALVSGQTIRTHEWLAFSAIGLICLLYIATVFSVALAVSAFSRASAPAMLVLVALWAVAILMTPALSTLLAWLTVRPESTDKAELALRVMADPGVPTPHADAVADACIEKIAGEWGVPAKDLRDSESPGTRELAWKAHLACGRQEYLRRADTFDVVFKQLGRKESLVYQRALWVNRLSPYGCLRNASTELAGTGFARESAMQEWAHALLNATHRAVYDVYRRRDNDARVSAAALPRFAAPERSTPAALRSAALDAAILALMCTLSFLVGHAAFVRREAA